MSPTHASPTTDSSVDQSDDALVARSGTTVSQIVDILKADIFNGALAPGQRLISRDLVERFNISRGPLREAFRQLAAERLVELVPNRGAIVRRLSAKDVANIYEIREALEGYVAAKAASKINEGSNRDDFLRIVERGRRHYTDPVFADFVVDNRDFHQKLVTLCGNDELSDLIDQYQLPVLVIQLRQLIGTDQVIRNAMVEHDRIAEAVLAGDSTEARAAMVAHLRHSCELILDLPSLSERTPRWI